MGKALLQKFVEGDSDKFKQMLTLGRDGGETIKPTAVEKVSFNQGELVQFMDELSGGERESLLTHLAFQQAVDEQGQHVEQEHRSNAWVFVQIDRGNLEVLLADKETFFPTILVPVELKHLLVREGIVIGDQQIATIEAFRLGQGLRFEAPMHVHPASRGPGPTHLILIQDGQAGKDFV